MAAGMKFVELRSGDKMPIIGLGTWKSAPGEVQRAVEAAIDAGYRHIDCAAIYGNETEVGAALKNKIGSVVKREELWITGKLWNTKHAPKDVIPAIKQSLEDLGLEYLDLYLIHWPMAFKPTDDGSTVYSDDPYTETWKAMEEAYHMGLVKNIGLSNFNHRQTQDIVDIAKVQPSMMQVECHPYLTQEKLLNFCRERGIQMTGFSPLGSPDRPWAKPDDPSLLQDPTLTEIAKKYGKTTAQVLIRFQVQRGVAVIPKSVNPERIKANMDVLDFELSGEDMATISNFNRDYRFVQVNDLADCPFFPFNEEY